MAQSEALQLLVERMFAACLSRALSSHSCPLVLSTHTKPARFYLAWPVGHRSQPSILAGTLFSSRTLRLLHDRPSTPGHCVLLASWSLQCLSSTLGNVQTLCELLFGGESEFHPFSKGILGKVPFNAWCGIPDPASPSTWLCQALLSLHVD